MIYTDICKFIAAAMLSEMRPWRVVNTSGDLLVYGLADTAYDMRMAFANSRHNDGTGFEVLPLMDHEARELVEGL